MYGSSFNLKAPQAGSQFSAQKSRNTPQNVCSVARVLDINMSYFSIYIFIPLNVHIRITSPSQLFVGSLMTKSMPASNKLVMAKTTFFSGQTVERKEKEGEKKRDS